MTGAQTSLPAGPDDAQRIPLAAAAVGTLAAISVTIWRRRRR
jgi:hypothetical protein